MHVQFEFWYQREIRNIGSGEISDWITKARGDAPE